MIINPSELMVTVYRAPAQGGWVMTPDKVVRITHVPSGFYIEEGTDRSPHRNRAEAMRKLQIIADHCPETFTGIKVVKGEIDCIRAAITEYYKALDDRQHGGVAQDKAFNKIQQILDMTWGKHIAAKS